MHNHEKSSATKKPTESSKGEIVIYQDRHKKSSLEVRLEKDTVWLNLNQMADLFDRDKSVISRHVGNVFKERELDSKSTVAKFATVQTEGGRTVERSVEYYSLDVIVSVGYRVKSHRGTQFRIWATGVLRDHIIKGVTVNQKRIQELKGKRLDEFSETLALLESAKQKAETRDETAGLLEIITDYAKAWLLFQQYDEGALGTSRVHKLVTYILTYDDARDAIEELKKELVRKREAGGLFGVERGNGFEAILGNLKQTFGGEELYPSIEDKAAHLLYFIIKDHPFADGNKRIGSLLFILFLARNHYLSKKSGERMINDNALVALALLIAESKPSQKEVMVKLIINLLSHPTLS